MDRIAIIDNFVKKEIPARPIPVGKTYFFSKNNPYKFCSRNKCLSMIQASFVSVAERNYFLCNWTRLALCVCMTPFLYFHFSHTRQPPLFMGGGPCLHLLLLLLQQSVSLSFCDFGRKNSPFFSLFFNCMGNKVSFLVQ